MTPSAASLALVAVVLAPPVATAFGGLRPSPNTPTGCTKNGCFFSYTNPAGVNQGRCGEVDAAPRMPTDIWNDQNAVREYILATTKWYNVDGVELKQKPCDRPGRKQSGSETVAWTTSTLMKNTCGNVCDCTYPLCPDSPDVPRNQQYCSLCGPKFNAPIKVTFWVARGPNPGPAPSPPPSGCTRLSCPFSYVNPSNVNGGRCGEVDASARMPGDIWGYPTAVQRYVDATLKYYNIGDNGGPEGGVLVQAPCDHTNRYQNGFQRVSWTDPELMRQTCSVLCYCNWPQCPDAPDDPGNQLDFCSLCGPTFNQPIEVELWYPKLAQLQ